MSRRWILPAATVALVAGWLALARPSGHPSVAPSPGPPRPSLTSTATPSVATPPPSFAIAHVRVRGQVVDLAAYRAPAGSLCVELASVEPLSCDFLLGPDQTIHLSFANWLHLDSTGSGFGVFVVGTLGPRVASVRIALGGGRSFEARILTLPAELGFPLRLFEGERRTGFESLNRRLPIVALDRHGREIGRIRYLIRGG